MPGIPYHPQQHKTCGDKNSPAVGKFTHPSGAPDNHLLTCYSPGPVNHQYSYLPQLDGGIYLIKNGRVVNQPSEMRLIKNDPNYNECWPRAVVPYRRIYGVPEPHALPRLANDGKLSTHLPAGTPHGLVGTSSFLKRETYPNGAVPAGSVTATYAGGTDPWKGLDAFTSHGNGMPLNWHNQGADAGLYTNADVWAVRVLAMEPTTDRKGANAGRRYFSHAGERLRVLGEVPLRKPVDGKEPLDPDGNPDTSFLARIPADLGFTFQTIDRHGMVLNAAQTWHQLRPGEVRTNCGGCHAHSQAPTPFEKTAAARPDYKLWDLTSTTPLIAARGDATRQAPAPVTVEYWRDVRPILDRSCVSCHTAKGGKEPAAKLNLDADGERVQHEQHGSFPGTYYRLALDERGKFGHRPPGWDSWGYPNASRYVRKFQSRRSLLVWNLYGHRLDGFANDDHPSETKPGSGVLAHRGQTVDLTKNRARFDLDYAGTPMPPPDSGHTLTDEDRRTITRWIDLGCPIDLDYDPAHPDRVGFGYMLDDQRPTLALSLPVAGANAELSRIRVGLHDYRDGLKADTFRVTADVSLGGVPAGENLAGRFRVFGDSVWEWELPEPVRRLPAATLTVSVADRQGNVTRVERRFRVGP